MKDVLLALFGLIATPTLGDWIYSLWHGPLHLSCQGQLTYDYEGSERTEPRTLLVEIDFSTEQVCAEGFTSGFKISSVGTVDVSLSSMTRVLTTAVLGTLADNATRPSDCFRSCFARRPGRSRNVRNPSS